MSELQTLKEAISGLGISADAKTKTVTCAIHGDYESRNIFKSIWSGCNACCLISEEKKAIEEKQREDAQIAYQWRNAIGRACIPERFTDRTLSTYIAQNEAQERVLSFAKEYADNFDAVLKTGRSIIFCGLPGTGKTHIAIGIALEIMKNRKVAIFTTAMRIIRRIKDSWRKDSEESESDIISLMASPDLLIIDEIGIQFGSEFERNVFFDILNDRYENRLPTIFMSNLTAEEIKSFLGERIIDRLKEDGGRIIPFNWESHRGKK